MTDSSSPIKQHYFKSQETLQVSAADGIINLQKKKKQLRPLKNRHHQDNIGNNAVKVQIEALVCI
jgi:hypothetical protein